MPDDELIERHSPRHGYGCWPCRETGEHCDAYVLAVELMMRTTELAAITADRDDARRKFARLTEALVRVTGQRDMLLARITDGGFCLFCDGFGPDGDQIVHREDCETRFDYTAHQPGDRREGDEGL